ncbi:outer membrane beta-barrel family protein [Neolewinella antarctica]|uniref:Outer membrane receptor protein involved in Fe transport n=1 Tax=Neolewinella antarctica TaxID=442734 RepID=A0ABX0XFL5_9BACT|nr:outer membrane beta-barrel family protein [Neolewinella antarctica]NJC27997.1 outer membrane receptor protein involved in Fe transport [Neolewinella antarctica]
MRTFFFLLLLFTIATQATAQISGRVLDKDQNTPVAFATVSLLAASDSSLISGTVTGSEGEWSLGGVETDKNYLVKASFIGYADRYSVLFSGNAAPSPITLHLRSAPNILRAVEVTGKQLTDLHRLDRQTFDAEQFANARGGTGADVIANLPSVSVDALGEISVRGATGFTVLIDGRPVQSNPATILAGLPANAIASVEVITTPGAQYDPDGKAGIINIVTKAGSPDGWSGVANVNYGLPSVEDYGNKDPQRRYAADVNLGYHQGKWDLGFGANYLRDDNAGRREGYVNTIVSNVLTEFPSDGERSHDRESYTGRASVTYRPDGKQTISAGLLAGKKTVFRTADILYRDQTRVILPRFPIAPETYYQDYLDRGEETSEGNILDRRTYYNENLRVRRGDFYIASVDYALDFGEGRKLSLSGLYERTVLGGPTDNLVIPERGSLDSLQYQFNTNDNPLDGYRFNVNYTTKIGELDLITGYQFRYLRHPGSFVYLDRDFANGGFTENPLFTNGITLRRDVHAGFGQVSGTTGKLEYSAGLRLEYFDRSVKLDRPDTTYLLDRLSLYPSANLLYQLADGWKLKAGYSRRIDRTTTFKMTPFPEREHNETLEQGDAELLPEVSDLVELGAVANFGNSSAFATAYYRRTRDAINRVNTIFNDTILNRIYTNVGVADALGLELGFTVFPTGGDWRVSLGGNIYRYQITGRVFGADVDAGNWVYSINATTDVDLFGQADLQLGVNYLSARVTAQGRDSRFFNPYLNLQREFTKQRLTVSFQWQNIGLGLWDNNQQRITTSAPDFFTTTNYVYEPDVLRVGVGYRFSGRKDGTRAVGSEFGEREF